MLQVPTVQVFPGTVQLGWQTPVTAQMPAWMAPSLQTKPVLILSPQIPPLHTAVPQLVLARQSTVTRTPFEQSKRVSPSAQELSMPKAVPAALQMFTRPPLHTRSPGVQIRGTLQAAAPVPVPLH